MARKKTRINIYLRGPQGFTTETVDALDEIDDGVFIVKYKNTYSSVDARTGINIGRNTKTKKEAVELYKSLKPRYLKAKQSNSYKNYAIVNKKNHLGEWAPQKVQMPNLYERRGEKKSNGSTYVNTASIIHPNHTDESVQRFLNVAANEGVDLPTIRKIYSNKGKIVKVVNYQKGSTLTKVSFFKKGKLPKGTKLTSKKFLKPNSR